MPGLIRGVARTAVIAGTASSVNGRVQRRQAEKFASRDAGIYAAEQQAYAAQQQQAYGSQPQYVAPAPAPAPPPAQSQDEVIRQLRELGELHAQGLLTDAEFAVQKSRVLNG
jgi:hypothetical protein